MISLQVLKFIHSCFILENDCFICVFLPYQSRILSSQLQDNTIVGVYGGVAPLQVGHQPLLRVRPLK